MKWHKLRYFDEDRNLRGYINEVPGKRYIGVALLDNGLSLKSDKLDYLEDAISFVEKCILPTFMTEEEKNNKRVAENV